MSAVSITGTILVHADKFLLSALLPLEQFGYYMLANALAGGINQLVGPVFGTMFPRLSQVAATGNRAAFSAIFHDTAQFLAVLVIPLAVLLALFPAEVLLAWTGNAVLADNSMRVLSLLAIANAMAGLANVLLMVEFADGRTQPAIWFQSLLIVLLPVLAYGLVPRYAALGGAMCWAILTGVMLFIRPVTSLARMPRSDLATWVLDDVARPLLSVVIIALGLRLLVPMPRSRPGLCCVLIAILAIQALVACRASRHVWRNVTRIGDRVRHAGAI